MTQIKFALRPLIIGLLLLFGLSSFAQMRTISGTITDAGTGEELIGVSIVIVGNETIGTISDFEGNYSLEVFDDATQIKYSYVGYQTTIRDITVDLGDVQLSSGELLEEIVVVGYGTQKTKEVTSAITSVKEEDFNRGNISDPVQLMQGKVAGLSIAKPGGDPNAGFTMRLRGLSTMGQNAEPLIVIDGVIGGDLKTVDPKDIASFSVLKDASAAAIYGSRGSSGVILITTKKGDPEKSMVEYSGSLSSESVSRFPQILSPSEYKQFSGTTDFGHETKWFEEITREAFTQAHNLSLSGGSKNSTYRVSANYRKGEGVALQSGFDQLNGRINFQQKALNDKLIIDASITSTVRNEEYMPYEAFGFAATYNPTAPVRSDSAEYEQYGGYFQKDAFGFFNPVAAIEQSEKIGLKKSSRMQIKGTYELLKGLKYNMSYAKSQSNSSYGNYHDIQSKWTSFGIAGLGNANRSLNNYSSQLFETGFNYGINYKKFNVKFLGGYSYQDYVHDGFYAETSGFIVDGTTFNNLGSGHNSLDKKKESVISSYKNDGRLIAFFGRATANYNDLAYFTANIRREGSTKFGVNHKWGTFTGFSAGIDIIKLVDIPMVDKLKLRAGYGSTGNEPSKSNLASLLYGGVGGQFFYDTTYIDALGPIQNPNPDLKWEVKRELDIGMDFSMFDYKLTGSIDYYKTKSEDLLLEFDVRIPPNLFERKEINLGVMESSGIELSLGLNEIALGPVKWSPQFTYSKYFQATVTKITSPELDTSGVRELADLGAPNLVNVHVIRLKEGEPVGQIMAPIYEGLDIDGNPVYKDVDGDGIFKENVDREVVGNGLPEYEFGLNNTFSIGNLSLNFFFRGVFGHSLVNVFNARYGSAQAIGLQNGSKIALDYIDAKEAPVYSDIHVEDASFIKLDNFTISYNFGSIIKKIRNLNISVSGQNLWTITNYTGVDPEVRYGGQPIAPGIDWENAYAPAKGYTLGLSFNF